MKLLALEIPTDEILKAGKKALSWLLDMKKKNFVNDYFSIQEKGLEIMQGNMEMIESLKQELCKGFNMIRTGGILMIRKILSMTTDKELVERLGEILIQLANDEETKPVVLRAGIELSSENEHFKEIWEKYYDSNKNSYSKNPLCKFLVDQDVFVQKYLESFKENWMCLEGIGWEIYSEMMSYHNKQIANIIDCYVDLSVTLDWRSDSIAYDFNNQINEFLRNEYHKVCVILGDAGSGKTMYCHKLCSRLLEQKSPYLPIYIYLPTAGKSMPNLLKQAFEVLGIDHRAKEILARNILFILDTYDEISGNPFLVEDNRIFDRYKNSKVLIMCRVHEAPPSRNCFARTMGGRKMIQKLTEVYIQPLTEKMIDEYIGKMTAKQDSGWESTEEVWDMIRSNNILHLMRNPFLLGISLQQSEIIKDLKREGKTINKLNLYRGFIKYYQEKEYNRAEMAQITISTDEFREKYYEKSIEFAFKIVKNEGATNRDIQISDTDKNIDPVCKGCPLIQVGTITKTNTIHGEREVDRQFGFIHPSIGDYFVACGILEIIENLKTKSVNSERAQIIIGSYLNTTELMDKTNVLEFIKDMINDIPEDKKENENVLY